MQVGTRPVEPTDLGVGCTGPTEVPTRSAEPMDVGVGLARPTEVVTWYMGPTIQEVTLWAISAWLKLMQANTPPVSRDVDGYAVCRPWRSDADAYEAAVRGATGTSEATGTSGATGNDGGGSRARGLAVSGYGAGSITDPINDELPFLPTWNYEPAWWEEPALEPDPASQDAAPPGPVPDPDDEIPPF